MSDKQFFTRALLQWHAVANHRSMPWKGINNPYLIWISEVILQQTRVEQGLAYYERFITRFPTNKELAIADEEEVLKYWEGLGYYSRARNLHFTAKYIYNELKNEFPTDYKNLLKLKGIGPYTAAAIASFAYNEPCAVVDGNVYRVIARYFAMDDYIDTTQGKAIYQSLAQSLLDTLEPALYNQAIMDLGATVCKPTNPTCPICPLAKHCKALLMDTVALFPIKSKKVKKIDRYFIFLVLYSNDKVLMQKRITNDIWKNLYAPPILEEEQPYSNRRMQLRLKKMNINSNNISHISNPEKWVLTHQNLHAQFVHIQCDNYNTSLDGEWLEKQELLKKPLPRFIQKYFLQLYKLVL